MDIQHERDDDESLRARVLDDHGHEWHLEIDRRVGLPRHHSGGAGSSSWEWRVAGPEPENGHAPTREEAQDEALGYIREHGHPEVETPRLDDLPDARQ